MSSTPANDLSAESLEATGLTEEQATLLHSLYFIKGNYFGRDKLWKLATETAPDQAISRRSVMKWLKRQELHQLYAPVRNPKTVRRTVPSGSMSQIGVDLVDMSTQEYGGQKWLLTAIDLYSKYLWVTTLPNKEARTVLDGLARIFARMELDAGLPRSMRTDNGSEFINAQFKAYLKIKLVRHILGSANRPETNGQVERINGVVKRGLSMYKTQSGSQDWVSFLPTFVKNYNNVVQRVIKMKPIEALYHKEKSEIKEVRDNIREEITPKNASLDATKYNVGDKVRLKLKNLSQSKGVVQGGTNYSREVYTIRSKSRPSASQEVSYRVDNSDGEKMDDILWASDLVLVPAIDSIVLAQKTFIVQRLIRPSMKKGVQGFIVRWKGYLAKDDTYETREQLMQDIPKTVQAFEKLHDVTWTVKSFKWKEKK